MMIEMFKPLSTVELPCRDWRDRGSPRPLSSFTFEGRISVRMIDLGHFDVHYLFLLGHGEEDEGKLDNVGNDLGLQSNYSGTI